jgi:hypothetical protein
MGFEKARQAPNIHHNKHQHAHRTAVSRCTSTTLTRTKNIISSSNTGKRAHLKATNNEQGKIPTQPTSWQPNQPPFFASSQPSAGCFAYPFMRAWLHCL